MFEHYNNTLCVSGSALIIRESNPNGLISKDMWDKLVKKGVRVARRASYGNSALIDFETLPAKYKDLITSKFGDPKEAASAKPFKDRILPDAAAITWYSGYKLQDGRYLPAETQKEYAVNASVLNAIKIVYNDLKNSRAKLGVVTKGFWANALRAVNEVRASLNHTLPATEVTLSRKYTKYINEGYAALVSGKYCNDNSRKVNDKIENLIMSLYTMTDNPFAGTVHTRYQLFLAGQIQLVDKKTGELFNKEDFYENGEPITISESTVWSYLNAPENRPIVDKVRMGGHRYNNVHRPHHHRHAPEFSFSKISMDDRDLPRKCNNGKWVKAYYAYDVTSGCVIGYSHNLDKNERLFIDCLRDMFRLIERERFGMPMEVEVEHHLVSNYKDELDVMFPFVRWCNPGNSQEKRAEHFNRAKKYSVEKKNHTSIGRWWAKGEAYTTDRDKKGDEFVEKKVYDYGRLVADDIADILEYNNQLHPKQKKYPGKTRYQVLTENMNPNLPEVSSHVIAKAIGVHQQTTIRRNQYVQIRGAKYQIENIAVLGKLLPNNYEVDAYFLPDAEGLIEQIYLYQNNVFICKCDKIVTYNESKSESTDKDYLMYQKQAYKVGEFDGYVKKGKEDLSKVVIIESKVLNEALAIDPEVVESAPEPSFNADSIIEKFNEGKTEQDAIDNL
jgi:hypothetical protein